MANAQKGEVGFTVDGTAWVLRYTANALCELEDHLGKTTGELIATMQDERGMSLKLLRSIFWGGLIASKPDVTVEQAGDLMDAVGVGKATDLVGAAFSSAFPDDGQEAQPDGEGARPRKGSEAGTGTKS